MISLIIRETAGEATVCTSLPDYALKCCVLATEMRLPDRGVSPVFFRETPMVGNLTVTQNSGVESRNCQLINEQRQERLYANEIFAKHRDQNL